MSSPETGPGPGTQSNRMHSPTVFHIKKRFFTEPSTVGVEIVKAPR
uniref:Uncharacterized protein n=1 Tax=Anguilla anguilla TaxID=7936 RepID=A0A0E9WAL3_ANGAN